MFNIEIHIMLAMFFLIAIFVSHSDILDYWKNITIIFRWKIIINETFITMKLSENCAETKHARQINVYSSKFNSRNKWPINIYSLAVHMGMNIYVEHVGINYAKELPIFARSMRIKSYWWPTYSLGCFQNKCNKLEHMTMLNETPLFFASVTNYHTPQVIIY